MGELHREVVDLEAVELRQDGLVTATMLELAELVLEYTGSASEVIHRPLPQDDPARRRPDISLATSTLGWAPSTQLAQGLRATVDYFSETLNADSVA